MLLQPQPSPPCMLPGTFSASRLAVVSFPCLVSVFLALLPRSCCFRAAACAKRALEALLMSVQLLPDLSYVCVWLLQQDLALCVPWCAAGNFVQFPLS